MSVFKGKKPPVGFISKLLKDKKEMEEGKILIGKKGLTAKKFRTIYIQTIKRSLNS